MKSDIIYSFLCYSVIDPMRFSLRTDQSSDNLTENLKLNGSIFLTRLVEHVRLVNISLVCDYEKVDEIG